MERSLKLFRTTNDHTEESDPDLAGVEAFLSFFFLLIYSSFPQNKSVTSYQPSTYSHSLASIISEKSGKRSGGGGGGMSSFPLDSD